MSVKENLVFKPYDGKDEYVKISFIPDFPKFNLSGMT